MKTDYQVLANDRQKTHSTEGEALPISNGMKKTLLSGMQPSGRAHIGNYFGAMKQWLDMQEDYNCMFFLADYHAMNSVHNREKMHDNILGLAMDYLAIGLDRKNLSSISNLMLLNMAS